MIERGRCLYISDPMQILIAAPALSVGGELLVLLTFLSSDVYARVLLGICFPCRILIAEPFQLNQTV